MWSFLTSRVAEFDKHKAKMAESRVSSSSTEEEENSPESGKKTKSLGHKQCYMHIASVKHEKKVRIFTIAQWNTYRNSLRRWLKLRGECRDVAENYKHCLDLEFETILKDAAFQPTCYQRFIDKNAIAKVERHLMHERERRWYGNLLNLSFLPDDW